MGRNAYITIKRFLREFYMNLSAGIIPFVLTIVSVIIFIFQETSPVMRYLISGLIISASGLAIYKSIIISGDYFSYPYLEELKIIEKRFKEPDHQGRMGVQTTEIALARNRGQYALPSSPIFEIWVEQGSKVVGPKEISINKQQLAQNLGFGLRRLINKATSGTSYVIRQYAPPFSRTDAEGKTWDVYLFDIEFKPQLSKGAIILYGYSYFVDRTYTLEDRYSYYPACPTKEVWIRLVAPDGYQFESVSYQVYDPVGRFSDDENKRLEEWNMVPKLNALSNQVEWKIALPIVNFEYRLLFKVIRRIQAT
jgi:hypothetical protein